MKNVKYLAAVVALAVLAFTGFSAFTSTSNKVAVATIQVYVVSQYYFVSDHSPKVVKVFLNRAEAEAWAIAEAENSTATSIAYGDARPSAPLIVPGSAVPAPLFVPGYAVTEVTFNAGKKETVASIMRGGSGW